MRHALGIVEHTGWAACIVAGGSLARSEIVANGRIDVLKDAERLCIHMAARLERTEAEP